MGKTRVLECRAGGLTAHLECGEKKQPKPDLRRKDNRIEAFICEKGEIIARGLGVFEEDTLGLYDIHVNREHRRKGAGTAICRALMEEGFRNGAKSAHLQVLSSNLEALSLYRSLGFQEIYLYWYRVKNG